MVPQGMVEVASFRVAQTPLLVPAEASEETSTEDSALDLAVGCRGLVSLEDL